MGIDGTVELSGPVAPGRAGAVLRRATSLLADPAIGELVCELSGKVDLSVVDALARLQLIANRRGVVLRVRVQSAGAELGPLLYYLGLAGAIATDS